MRIEATKIAVREAPITPGVYLYKDSQGKILYIGKAKNIKSRLSSYFGSGVRGKAKRMLREARIIKIILTDSEFEALLLEAFLVKKHKPRYNSALKDDKSPLYIGITKEDYPRILALRQTDLKNYKLSKTYGPYLNSNSVKQILRKLRKIFPYSTHKPGKRACMNSQIGLCNPCPSVITNTKDLKEKEELLGEYKHNVSQIRKVLSRRLKGLRRDLLREMEEYSEKQEYEKAKKKYEQVLMLDYVTRQPVDTKIYLKNPNFLEDVREEEIAELKEIVSKHINIGDLKRIECYDIAHLAGIHPTASMVTFINGEPEKKFYRHFKIRRAKKADDYGALRETIKRRKKHLKTWGKPDLVIVDGGKGQVRVFEEEIGDVVPVVGVAKRRETLIFMVNGKFESYLLPEGGAKRLVQRLRNEAHRFARRYHHKLVGRQIKESH